MSALVILVHGGIFSTSNLNSNLNSYISLNSAHDNPAD